MRTIDISNPASLGALKSGATLSYANFGKSGMKFTLACPRIDSPAPYEYMEGITLMYKGVRVLVGQVTECKQVLQGSSYVWSVAIYDRWWFFENSMYLNPKKPNLNSFFREPANRVINNVVSVKASSVLKTILDNAVLNKSIEGYDISFVSPDATIESFEASGSYADVLGAVKGYRPSLIAFFDYSREMPTLVIADQDKVSSYMLDMKAHSLESIELTPRYDLVSTAVGVIYVAPTYSEKKVSYPPGADLSQPGSVVHKIQAPQETGADTQPEEEEKKRGIGSDTWNFTKQSMEVKGNKLPQESGEGRGFWEEKIPVLKKVPQAIYLTPKPTAIPLGEGESNASYSESANKYELVSGSVSEKCKTVRWCKTRLQQYVEIKGSNPPSNLRHIFNQQLGVMHWRGLLTWEGITINTARKSYTIAPEGTGPGESDEPPPQTEEQENQEPSDIFNTQLTHLIDVCKEYYECTQIVPWEGTVVCNNPPPVNFVVGATLCIRGGRKEWESMKTVIEGVGLDAFTGKLSINTGVPDHLSFDKMLDRSKLLDRKRSTSNESRDKGLTDDPKNKNDMNFQWDNRAKQIPKAPTVSPNGKVVQGEIDDGFEFGFQVRLIKNIEGKVTGSMVRQGHIMLNGSYVNSFVMKGTGEDSPSENTWVPTNVTSGDIYVTIQFLGTKTNRGKYISPSYVSGAPGDHNPFALMLTAIDKDTDVRTISYAIKIASINNETVVQHALGTIYLQTQGGTFYPYGPA